MAIWSSGRNADQEVPSDAAAATQYDRMERGNGVPDLVGGSKGSSGHRSTEQQQRDPIIVGAISGSTTKKRSWKRCCCITCCCLVSILVALGIVALVLYLVYKPKTPQIGISDVSLHFIGISPNVFNLTAPQLETLFVEVASGTASLTLLSNISYMLEVHNPNKVQLGVGQSSIAMYYQTLMVSNGTIPAFNVAAHGTEVMPVTLPSEVQLPKALTIGAVNDILSGSIVMRTFVSTKANIKVWGITTPSVTAKTICNTKLQVLTLSVESNNCTTAYS